MQLRRSVGLDAALATVLTDSGRNSMKRIEAILETMAGDDESGLLARRLADADHRGLWARRLLLAGMATALLALSWAARMLNRAWAHTHRVEAEQRTVALQLRASLDSLSQGVAVFGADHGLSNWERVLPGAARPARGDDAGGQPLWGVRPAPVQRRCPVP